MADIVAVHNTTPRRIRFANKLGGMPCPSIAYINTDHLYDSFGDITLICSPNMANPAQSSLYVCDSDIYSGRFPSIFHSIDEIDLKDILQRSIEISNLFSEKASLVTRIIDFLETNTVEEAIFSIHRFPELFIQFEEEVLGKKFDHSQWEKEIPRFQCDLSSRPKVQKWIRDHFKKTGATYIDAKSSDISELKTIISNEIDHLAKITSDAVAKKCTSNYMKNKDFDFFRKAFQKDYLGENDKKPALSIRTLTQLERDYQIWSREVDPLDIKGLEDYVKNQEDDVKARFERWMSETLEPSIKESFFYHETPSGNRVKKSLSLENVTKSMKRQLRGGENFHYGAGNVRAQVANSFRKWRSLESRAHLLSSEIEFEKTKKEFNKRYSDLIDELRPFYRFDGGNSFLQTDDISNILSEYAGGRGIALKEGFKVDEDFPAEKIDSFIEDLKNAPTQYFEGKFKREVLLSEYAGAAIPNDIAESAQDIIEILVRNNIPYEVYDPDTPGDRECKIKSLSNELNLSRAAQHPDSLLSPKK